jgi:hypothetical protein
MPEKEFHGKKESKQRRNTFKILFPWEKYYRSLSKLLMSFWSFMIPRAAKM